MVDQTTRTDRSGLSSLAQSLDSFFTGAAKLTNAQWEQEQRRALDQIEQENKDLAQMAQADMLAGVARRPEYADRRAYLESYDRTEGVLKGQQFADAYHEMLATAPKDGSFDFKAAREKLMAEHFGKGTGNPIFDSEFLLTAHRAAERSESAFQDAVIKTAEANGVARFTTRIADLVGKQEVTRESVGLAFSDALGLTKGDVGKARDLLAGALVAPAKNPEQMHGVLKAMELAGMETSHPEIYGQVTAQYASRVQHPNTLEGLQAWAQVNDRVSSAIADPRLTVEDMVEMRRTAHETFMRHAGLGNYQRITSELDAEIMRRAKSQADVNFVAEALVTGRDLPAVLAKHGHSGSLQSIVDKQFWPVMAQVEQAMPGFSAQYPALSKSRLPDGSYDFMGSPQAAREFARFLSANRNVMGAIGGLLPSQVKDQVLMGLRDLANPQKAGAAYEFMRQYEATSPSTYQFEQAVKNDDALSLYYAVKAATSVDGRITPETVFKRMADNPSLVQTMNDVRKGSVDWQKLTGDTSKKSSEIEKNLDDVLAKSIGKWVEDRPWYDFGSSKVSIPYGGLRDQLRSAVARHVGHQLIVSGRVDLDAAVKYASETMKGKLIPLPGQKGNLAVIEDPFAGEGRVWGRPLAKYNGREVYSPFPLINSPDKDDNPLDTYYEDAAALVKKFPTSDASEVNQLALVPDNLKAKGMFSVVDSTGAPLAFKPGDVFKAERKRRVGRGVTDFSPPKPGEGQLTVPSDPKEAFDFLMKNLPPGFQVEREEYMGQTRFRLLYGFRSKKGTEIVQQQAAKLADTRKNERPPIRQKPDDSLRPPLGLAADS